VKREKFVDVTIGEDIKLTGANRNTLKKHFLYLTEIGHLNQLGSGVLYGITCADLINFGHLWTVDSSIKIATKVP